MAVSLGYEQSSDSSTRVQALTVPDFKKLSARLSQSRFGGVPLNALRRSRPWSENRGERRHTNAGRCVGYLLALEAAIYQKITFNGVNARGDDELKRLRGKKINLVRDPSWSSTSVTRNEEIKSF